MKLLQYGVLMLLRLLLEQVLLRLLQHLPRLLMMGLLLLLLRLWLLLLEQMRSGLLQCLLQRHLLLRLLLLLLSRRLLMERQYVGTLMRLMGLVMMDGFRSPQTCGVSVGMHGLGGHAMHGVAVGWERCVGRVRRR